MELFYKQSLAIDVLEDGETNELVFGGGANGGKSRVGVYWILKCCVRYPGTRWLIGRAVLKTLFDTTIKTLEVVCKEQGIISGKHFNYNDNRKTFYFENGSEIICKDLATYPSDPDFNELGSLELTGAFIDECNQIEEKAWNIVRTRIRFMLEGIDNTGKPYQLIPKILGTCNPDKNWVFTKYYLPWVRKELPTRRKFIQALAGDNPAHPNYYKQFEDSDPATRARLLEGDWMYDSDVRALISNDAINDVFHNDFIKPDESKKRLSADLAMMGRDRFIVCYWKGDVVRIEIDKKQNTGRDIERDLIALMEAKRIQRSHVIFDASGMGNYLESYLAGTKAFHAQSTPFNKETFANLKAECGYKLADKINKGQLKIVCTSEQEQRIRQELAQLKAKAIDTFGKKDLMPKSEIRRNIDGGSPDYLDALIMGMYFELGAKQLISVIPGLN